MRVMNVKKLATVFAILGVALLSGCGNNSSNSPPITGAVGVNGFGYNGQIGAAGGCAPINQPFSFRIDGAYFDSANLIGGHIPQTGTQIGQGGILGSGGNFTGQYVASNFNYGTVSLQISQLGALPSGYAPYSGYPSQYAIGNPYAYSSVSPTQVTTMGTIQIGGAIYQQIMNDMGAYAYNGFAPTMQTGFFQYPGAQQMPLGGGMPCVSQVAVNLGHSGLHLYGGQVFLYMNGTANGYVLQY